MNLVTWDTAAVILALIAVLLRLADHPRAAALTASLSVLAASVAGWTDRRNRRLEDVRA